MKHYIFDVDGTLTPSRGKIDEEFSKLFFDFCCLNLNVTFIAKMNSLRHVSNKVLRVK